MDSKYNHKDHEQKIYGAWEKSGGFEPTDGPGAKPFTIIMPPPNANDPLHVGHAMFVSLEDVMIRVARMQGKAALWLPGTDHAGIETQFVFEKKLAKEGKSRFDFDRETLYQMIWEYVQENSGVAVEQMKRMGASADWGRFKFMLEPPIVAEVIQTFEKLNKDGLVYRDMQLVNYCTHCGTAFSSLEVEHEERVSPFYKIKYGKFAIGTVRPETKFRDTALAVHPDDPRYKDEIGKEYEIRGLLGTMKMKIIADPLVDPEFGTGIMKVTPAHDPHDFELGKKYNLPVTPIIGFDGLMDFSWYLDDPNNQDEKYLSRAKKYHGLKVAAMRREMKKDFEEDGLLIEYDPNYKHRIGVCYRCKRPLEPLPLPQFFVKVEPLTEKVLTALKDKRVKVLGSGHDKILKHWLSSLNDWNVSRQIVWGIRMPVWYRIKEKVKNPTKRAGEQKSKNDMVVRFLDKSGELVAGNLGELMEKYSLEEIKKGLQSLRAPVGVEFVVSPTSPGEDYIQETDTFDTWFSSAQWPFNTLKNAKPGDLERFYPTQVMETAYDILMFWVMRMLMVGIYKTGKVPFETVYLHGLIRDEKGQKMSKSKGNVVNPLSVIEKYGADALRMALVIRSTPGQDKNVGEQDFRSMRNLTNKIWNSARFVMMNLENQNGSGGAKDKEFKESLNKLVSEVTKQLEKFQIGLAADRIYNEFWHWYCDECIEKAKNEELKTQNLLEGLVVFLKLLHPFVPFVTEAVWGELQRAGVVEEKEMLMNSSWPQAK